MLVLSLRLEPFASKAALVVDTRLDSLAPRNTVRLLKVTIESLHLVSTRFGQPLKVEVLLS